MPLTLGPSTRKFIQAQSESNRAAGTLLKPPKDPKWVALTKMEPWYMEIRTKNLGLLGCFALTHTQIGFGHPCLNHLQSLPALPEPSSFSSEASTPAAGTSYGNCTRGGSRPVTPTPKLKLDLYPQNGACEDKKYIITNKSVLPKTLSELDHTEYVVCAQTAAGKAIQRRRAADASPAVPAACLFFVGNPVWVVVKGQFFAACSGVFGGWSFAVSVGMRLAPIPINF